MIHSETFLSTSRILPLVCITQRLTFVLLHPLHSRKFLLPFRTWLNGGIFSGSRPRVFSGFAQSCSTSRIRITAFLRTYHTVRTFLYRNSPLSCCRTLPLIVCIFLSQPILNPHVGQTAQWHSRKLSIRAIQLLLSFDSDMLRFRPSRANASIIVSAYLQMSASVPVCMSVHSVAVGCLIALHCRCPPRRCS